MRTQLGIIIILLVFIPCAFGAQTSFNIEKISPRLYAAITTPGSTATSNAFFYVGQNHVVAGGAHMTQQATQDLVAAIRNVTDRPLRYFILPHHHPGYTSVDFYFPEGVDLVMTYPVWLALQNEVIPFPNEAILYSEGLTMKLGGKSIILTNMGKAHATGDSLVYFPDEKTVFTSDMVYVESVGYMGEGHMEDWVLALEFMSQLTLVHVIPGHGPVSKPAAIAEFKAFYKTFLSEIIKHIEAGDSLEKTKRQFNLPGYRDYAGYDQMLELNIERAYRNLKETVLKP